MSLATPLQFDPNDEKYREQKGNGSNNIMDHDGIPWQSQGPISNAQSAIYELIYDIAVSWNWLYMSIQMFDFWTKHEFIV